MEKCLLHFFHYISQEYTYLPPSRDVNLKFLNAWVEIGERGSLAFLVIKSKGGACMGVYIKRLPNKHSPPSQISISLDQAFQAVLLCFHH